MTSTLRNPVDTIKNRFMEMGIETSDPKWSSWVIDRLLEGAVSAPGGSLRDVYVGLDATLRECSVRLTETVANLIKDVVVIPVVYRPSVAAVSSKLHVRLSGWGSYIGDLHNWYADA